MPGGRPKSLVCKHGHEIAKVGRYANGMCRGCALGNDNPPQYTPGVRGRKALCANGHPLTPENRYIWRGQYKSCLTCHRAASKAYRIAKGMKARTPKIVPSDPMFVFVDKIGLKKFSRQAASVLRLKAGSVERMLWRAREDGMLTINAADDLCVALGRHPVEVFGPVWFTYGAEVADAV